MASETINHKKTWLEFIQLYKENPCLWQKKYNKPAFQSERILAYNLILEKYWEIDKNATIEIVKKKIQMLRGGVRRERRKILQYPKYETKLWYYPHFKFIIEEMRAKCCVYGCKSATYNKQGYNQLFHRFPKNLERRKLWMRFCQNSTLSTKSHVNLWICSRHFEKSMYCNDLLMRSAIPTLNPPKKDDTKLDLDTDLEFTANNDVASASGSARKTKAQRKPGTGQKQMKFTSEVIEIIGDEEDCESVTFSSEDEGSEEDAVLNNDDDQSIMDFVKDEYQPIPSTSKEPVVVGSKLSLGDNTVEPIYECNAVFETLPGSGVQTEVLPPISSIRSAASPASVTNVDLDDDDCGTFAAHIKARMRNFSPGQKIIAQKLISDILFMADLQQLQVGSSVFHVRGQSEGPPNGAPAVKRQKGSFLAYLDTEDKPSTSKMKK